MVNKRILILGPYLNERAGVSSFAHLLLNRLAKYNYNIKYFPIGKRQLFMYTAFLPLYLLSDITKFILTLISFKPDVIHINPSLGRKSMVRDSIYLFLEKVFRYNVLLLVHGWHQEIS